MSLFNKSLEGRLADQQKLIDKAYCVNQVIRLAMQAEMMLGPSCRFKIATMAEKRIKEL